MLSLLPWQPVVAEPLQFAFLQMGQLMLKDEQTSIQVDGETLDGKYDDLPLFTGGVQRVLAVTVSGTAMKVVR